MHGFVYVLTNPYLVGGTFKDEPLVKIGMTTRDFDVRIKELNASTSVPGPFVVEYVARVDNPEYVERQLHKIFFRHRVNDKREFFTVLPEEVIMCLALAEHVDVTDASEFTRGKNEFDPRCDF